MCTEYTQMYGLLLGIYPTMEIVVRTICIQTCHYWKEDTVLFFLLLGLEYSSGAGHLPSKQDTK